MEQEWGNMFSSEQELLDTLDHHDRLLLECAREHINFADFLELYNYFYSFYALDGHESDEGERALLDKYEDRILPHMEMTHEILGNLCADEDGEKKSYIDAGRYGSAEALRRTKLLVERYYGTQG